MKKGIRFTALLLIAAIVISVIGPKDYQAAENSLANNIYLDGYCETVEIGDTIYTYRYFCEDDNRVIEITNNKTNDIEKVSCKNSEVCINEEKFVRKKGAKTMQARAGWEYVGTITHKISFGESTSVAAIAALLALYIPGATVLRVIAKGGFTVLSVVAANSKGGTIYVETYWLQIAYQPTQYMYKAKFIADTGEVIGPMTFLQG